MVCSKYTPVVDLSEGRKASDPEEQENVSLANPGAKWKTVKDPGQLESGKLFIAGAGTLEDDNAGLRQVDFRIEDLAGLRPDQVYADGKTESLRTFAAQDCS